MNDSLLQVGLIKIANVNKIAKIVLILFAYAYRLMGSVCCFLLYSLKEKKLVMSSFSSLLIKRKYKSLDLKDQ